MTPLYIKGVQRIHTTGGDTIPIPIFFTSDFVNQAIATNIGHVSSLALSASDYVVFIDCMDTLMFLQCKNQSALELFNSVLEDGTIINKTDESIEQIEDKLTNGSGHGGYLCLIKITSDISSAGYILTILTYVAP